MASYLHQFASVQKINFSGAIWIIYDANLAFFIMPELHLLILLFGTNICFKESTIFKYQLALFFMIFYELNPSLVKNPVHASATNDE